MPGWPILLNYAAMVDDGVMVGKNGAFMAAWLYKGSDNASSTDEQREAVSLRINQALSGLGNGWMVHVDAARLPAPNYLDRGSSHFPDGVSAAIDEERRQLFEGLGTMYEGYYVLTLTYFPALLAQRKFVELMFDDDTQAPDQKASTRGLIEFFKRECATIESRLSSAVMLQRLRGHKVVNEDGSQVTHDDFLRWLQFCVTGINHPLQLPTNPMYLDALIGGQEMWTGVVPKVGRQFIQVGRHRRLPAGVHAGHLDRPGRAALRIPLVVAFHLHGHARGGAAPRQVPQEVAAEDSRLLRPGVQHQHRVRSIRTRSRWSPMPKRPSPKSIAAWSPRATTPASSCSWTRIAPVLKRLHAR
jgi:hypothetical protein